MHWENSSMQNDIISTTTPTIRKIRKIIKFHVFTLRKKSKNTILNFISDLSSCYKNAISILILAQSNISINLAF